MNKVEEKIAAEFNPIMDMCKEMELLSEEKLPSLDNKTDETSIKLFLEFLRELEGEYERFLEEVRPIAGELAGSSKIGEKSLKRFSDTKELLEDLKLGLEELKDLLPSSTNYNNEENSGDKSIQELKEEYIKLINKKSKQARKFFSQEIYDLMEKLKNQAEQLEIYYS